MTLNANASTATSCVSGSKPTRNFGASSAMFKRAAAELGFMGFRFAYPG